MAINDKGGVKVEPSRLDKKRAAVVRDVQRFVKCIAMLLPGGAGLAHAHLKNMGKTEAELDYKRDKNVAYLDTVETKEIGRKQSEKSGEIQVRVAVKTQEDLNEQEEEAEKFSEQLAVVEKNKKTDITGTGG